MINNNTNNTMSEILDNGRYVYDDESWTKKITRIDTTRNNGHAFEGEFRDFNTSIPCEEALYVVKQKVSRKNAYYYIVRTHADGGHEVVAEHDTAYNQNDWAPALIAVCTELDMKGVSVR